MCAARPVRTFQRVFRIHVWLTMYVRFVVIAAAAAVAATAAATAAADDDAVVVFFLSFFLSFFRSFFLSFFSFFLSSCLISLFLFKSVYISYITDLTIIKTAKHVNKLHRQTTTTTISSSI